MEDQMNKLFDYVKVEKHVPEEVCDFIVSNYSDWKTASVDGGKVKKEFRVSDTCWIRDKFWKQSF